MEIFTLPDIGVVLQLQSAETCDIDIKTIMDVDPARIDNVMTLSSLSLTGPGIDIEKVLSDNGTVRGGILDDCVVVMIGEICESSIWDLGIHIPIPGQNLRILLC